MKYRVSQWLDTSNLKVESLPIRYGVQANVDGEWKHCHRDGEALIFKTTNEAKACIAKLQMESNKGEVK